MPSGISFYFDQSDVQAYLQSSGAIPYLLTINDSGQIGVSLSGTETISLAGISGYSGYSGYSGTSGFSGFSGFSGTSGFSGFSGTSGFSGFSGFSGTSGFSGFSGTGDVVGPASAVDNSIATFSGTSGKSLRDVTGVTITPSGTLNATNIISTSGTIGIINSSNFDFNPGIPGGYNIRQQGPKTFYHITPLAATTVGTQGGAAASVAATLSTPGWGAAFGWGQLATTTTVAGNNAGVTGATGAFAYLSGNSTIGNMGWQHTQRIHQPNAVTGINSCRIIAGMVSANSPTTFVGADAPSIVSYVMLQSCTASGSARQDTTWQIAVGNAGVQTLIDTTLPQTSGSVYDLYLSMPNVPTGGSKTLNWQLKNTTSNTQASGTSTATNLPAPSVPMFPCFQIATYSSGTPTAAALRYSYNYTESII